METGGARVRVLGLSSWEAGWLRTETVDLAGARGPRWTPAPSLPPACHLIFAVKYLQICSHGN